MQWRVRHYLSAISFVALVLILVTVTDKSDFRAMGDYSEVQARPSDSLADFIGVNVHDLYTDSQYEQIYKPRLREAEIRYIRGDMQYMEMTILKKLSELSNPTNGKPPVKYLGISTYRAQYPGSALNDCFATLVKTMVKGGKILCGSSLGQTLVKPIKLAGIEDPNEVDHCISNDPVCQPKLPANATWWQDAEANNPNWIADTENTVKNIHTKLKSDPATASIPILAPTFVHLSSFRSDPHPPYGDLYGKLLKLRPYFDYGNAHIYCETTPLNALCLSRWYQPPADFAGKPLIITETGYFTNPAKSWHVNETLQEKYGMRELLDFYDLGVKQAYIYQLIDEVSVPGIGILHLDGSPKPIFTSIKNLNVLLDNRGAVFVPGKLAYKLTGDTARVKQTLLQKRDGSFWLVLRYDPSTSNNVLVKKPVTISLASKAESVRIYNLSSAGVTQSFSNVTSLSLDVPDRVIVAKITLAKIPAISVPKLVKPKGKKLGANDTTDSKPGATAVSPSSSRKHSIPLANLLLPKVLLDSDISDETAAVLVSSVLALLFLIAVGLVKLVMFIKYAWNRSG